MPNPKPPYDLEQRTLQFAKSVIQLCQSLKNSPVNQELIRQLVRAASSVGANYREANESLSKKDFSHRVRIARREAKEAHYWLELVQSANPNLDGSVTNLLDEVTQLRKILSSIAQKAE